ncbi:hypothetical protein GLYMA_02G215401v4 [Glycine max]|nr:hypothetical protein GLYMA_02G215401v4 [Glycine max]KAH1061471.1 hypothetical protein GYH30_004789 [Glycine max]
MSRVSPLPNAFSPLPKALEMDEESVPPTALHEIPSSGVTDFLRFVDTPRNLIIFLRREAILQRSSVYYHGVGIQNHPHPPKMVLNFLVVGNHASLELIVPHLKNYMRQRRNFSRH